MSLADFRADGTRQEYDLRDDAPGAYRFPAPELGGTTDSCGRGAHWSCVGGFRTCACDCHPTAPATPVTAPIPAQRSAEPAHVHP